MLALAIYHMRCDDIADIFVLVDVLSSLLFTAENASYITVVVTLDYNPDLHYPLILFTPG